MARPTRAAAAERSANLRRWRRTRRGGRAAGQPQPVDEWIERFRSKTTERTRQAEDGRWFDWSEKATASGLTVGLRVEVTDIKRHEQAIEQARTEYQTLVDSLADVAYRLDVTTGKFTFVSASAADLFGVPPEKVVGAHFLDYVAPQSQDQVRNTTTRPYDPRTGTSPASHGGAGGNPPCRGAGRRRIDEQGHLISTGVIRDVEERVQLEARLERK